MLTGFAWPRIVEALRILETQPRGEDRLLRLVSRLLRSRLPEGLARQADRRPATYAGGVSSRSPHNRQAATAKNTASNAFRVTTIASDSGCMSRNRQ